MSKYKNDHLDCVLKSHAMSHVEGLILKYRDKRDLVKEKFEGHFSGKLCSSPINSGSYAKKNAINTKFDLDTAAPFKRDAFDENGKKGTLADMAKAVFDYFNGPFRKEAEDLLPGVSGVRDQSRSIGLSFIVDGEQIDIDVVPGRELHQGSYLDPATATDLNLFDTKRAEENEGRGEIKTNIQKHIDLIKGKNREREIVKLLKVWKKIHSPDIKSFVMEMVTIRAFELNEDDLPTGLWNRLKMVMEYIRDNFENISLPDPANSNNDVAESMTKTERKDIAEEMGTMVQKIEGKESTITFYFPANPKFPCEKKRFQKKPEHKKYIPPTTFG